MCWLSITTGGRGWLCSNGHICSASQGLTLAARPHLPRNGGLHRLPRTHTQRYAPTFHQALLHRRQARGLQNRCGHIPKRLRTWRKRRHGRAERLPDAYDTNRKTTRRLLPQAGHTARCAHDEGATAVPDNTGYGYNTIIGELGDHSVPEGWVQRPKFNDKGDVPGPPIQWQKPEDPDNAQPGYGYVPVDTTNIEEIFFYHSDHLGSTSYITDAKANITQIDAYLPYGELLVDEHSSTEEMPYKFNGKEFDQETGLYYYGARYMKPNTSLWYGVDPLAEKYPDIGGYVYCISNPIQNTDKKGNDVIIHNIDKNGKHKTHSFSGFRGRRRIYVPNNHFVMDFIHSYVFNTNNGGGENMKKAVLDHNVKVYVWDASQPSLFENPEGQRNHFDDNGGFNITWFSRKATRTSDGGVISPATIIEHEFAHFVNRYKDKREFERKSETPNRQYGDEEEKEVIEGAEWRTARKNGETIRHNHKGKSYDVTDPRTTKPKKKR